MTLDWTDVATWAATRLPVEEASSLPAACYTDPEFFALEQDRLFATSWVAVGLTAELESEGPERPLLVREVGGRSILITRNDDEELRAFLNTCRHRGTQLASCDGTIDGVIRCPYHRWGYDLDGQLIATPRFDEVPVTGFDRADYPLHSVRVESWNGLLLACLDPATPTVEEWFGDLTARLAGYQLHTWAIRDRVTLSIAANWKLITENFQEYYHLPWVHPELAKVSRVADHYRYQGPGMYCGQCTTPVSGDERDEWTAMPPAPGLGPSDRTSGRFVALFPNVMLAVLPNHAFVILLDPTEPGRTVERAFWLLPPASHPDDDQFETTKVFWMDVNNEDIDIVEQGQRGMEKGYPEPGRLSPRFEEPLHRFHNMVADRMTGIRRLPDGDPSDDDDLYGSGNNPLPWVRGPAVH